MNIMRDFRQANKGQPFEELLRFVHERYETAGEAVMRKVPTEFIPIRNAIGQVCSVKVENKSSVDFLGRYKNIPVAAEAKHTSGDRIPFAQVEDHQAEFLDVWDAPGVAALVLVSYKLERFYAIPWTFWKAARDAWRKQRGERIEVKAYGRTWITPGMASVRADQLLTEWEIFPGGSTGLPYMDIITRLEMIE
ncbi:MAG: Holliday junction resolvase RecU [Clostridia bacterium]|nr:Holliday junction resolvase RecU [Clostridia bacterium]